MSYDNGNDIDLWFDIDVVHDIVRNNNIDSFCL